MFANGGRGMQQLLFSYHLSNFDLMIIKQNRKYKGIRTKMSNMLSLANSCTISNRNPLTQFTKFLAMCFYWTQDKSPEVSIVPFSGDIHMATFRPLLSFIQIDLVSLIKIMTQKKLKVSNC